MGSGARVPVLALYRFLLRHKFKMPVRSYLVLMSERYAPRELPNRLVYEDDDGMRIETPYQAIRLWEVDPGVAFARGMRRCFPGSRCCGEG